MRNQELFKNDEKTKFSPPENGCSEIKKLILAALSFDPDERPKASEISARVKKLILSKEFVDPPRNIDAPSTKTIRRIYDNRTPVVAIVASISIVAIVACVGIVVNAINNNSSGDTIIDNSDDHSIHIVNQFEVHQESTEDINNETISTTNDTTSMLEESTTISTTTTTAHITGEKKENVSTGKSSVPDPGKNPPVNGGGSGETRKPAENVSGATSTDIATEMPTEAEIEILTEAPTIDDSPFISDTIVLDGMNKLFPPVRGRIIIGYKDPDNLPETLEIESIINGEPVVCIGADAFDNTNIHTLIIPDTVVQIDSNAFSNCPYLHYIVLGSEIKMIGDEAFYKSQGDYCEEEPTIQVRIENFGNLRGHFGDKWAGMPGDYKFVDKDGNEINGVY